MPFRFWSFVPYHSSKVAVPASCQKLSMPMPPLRAHHRRHLTQNVSSGLGMGSEVGRDVGAWGPRARRT